MRKFLGVLSLLLAAALALQMFMPGPTLLGRVLSRFDFGESAVWYEGLAIIAIGMLGVLLLFVPVRQTRRLDITEGQYFAERPVDKMKIEVKKPGARSVQERVRRLPEDL